MTNICTPRDYAERATQLHTFPWPSREPGRSLGWRWPMRHRPVHFHSLMASRNIWTSTVHAYWERQGYISPVPGLNSDSPLEATEWPAKYCNASQSSFFSFSFMFSYQFSQFASGFFCFCFSLFYLFFGFFVSFFRFHGFIYFLTKEKRKKSTHKYLFSYTL